MTFFQSESLLNFPYDSKRKPVLARNIVATSQPLAAQAGLDMLRRGGNAVDAALAAAIALTVVEPTGNGIGSDAFALIWDGKKLHGLNGSGRSPSGWSPNRFAACDSMPELGWDSVTVPGAVDAWSRLSQRFGQLPFARLFEPAIGYAEQGFLVTPAVASIWAEAPERFQGYEEFAKTFLPGGRPPAVGEPFACPQQAETLRKIAATDGQTFYRGELAERIAAQAAAGGSALTLQDLAEHTSEWVTPQAHLQMIVRIFDYGLNPQTASDAPRWYVAEDFRLALESGLPDNLAAELAERGHRLMPDPPTRLFGGAQLTACLPDGYCGASDHRKDGQAVGF